MKRRARLCSQPSSSGAPGNVPCSDKKAPKHQKDRGFVTLSTSASEISSPKQSKKRKAKLGAASPSRHPKLSLNPPMQWYANCSNQISQLQHQMEALHAKFDKLRLQGSRKSTSTDLLKVLRAQVRRLFDCLPPSEVEQLEEYVQKQEEDYHLLRFRRHALRAQHKEKVRRVRDHPDQVAAANQWLRDKQRENRECKLELRKKWARKCQELDEIGKESAGGVFSGQTRRLPVASSYVFPNRRSAKTPSPVSSLSDELLTEAIDRELQGLFSQCRFPSFATLVQQTSEFFRANYELQIRKRLADGTASSPVITANERNHFLFQYRFTSQDDRLHQEKRNLMLLVDAFEEALRKLGAGHKKCPFSQARRRVLESVEAKSHAEEFENWRMNSYFVSRDDLLITEVAESILAVMVSDLLRELNKPDHSACHQAL